MTHRHFRVNGRVVNVPSYVVKVGDQIEIGERSKKSPLLQSNLEVAKRRRAPEWLDWSEEASTAKVTALPSREQIDTPVDEQLIVEYYSR